MTGVTNNDTLSKLIVLNLVILLAIVLTSTKYLLILIAAQGIGTLIISHVDFSRYKRSLKSKIDNQ